MSVKYKYVLPCDCGQEILVEATQSGQEVTCQCGKRLEVPTMRTLRTLKIVKRPEAGPSASSTWGARQAVLMLGVLIALAGVAWAGYLLLQKRSVIGRLDASRPKIVDIHELSPYQAWVVWQEEIRPGLHEAAPWEEAYQRGMRNWEETRLRYARLTRWWLSTAGTLIGVGVVTVGISFLIPRPGARRKTPGPRSPARGGPNRR